MIKKLIYVFFFLLLFLINTNVYASNNIENILKTNNHIIVNMNYKEELVARRIDLDLIKGKDKSITYNILDNNKLLYSFKFNGRYFNDSYNDIDLKIEYNSDKENYINEYFKTNKKIIFKTKYSGYYPNGTTLSINNDKNIKKIKVYNLNDNKFNIINNIENNDNYIKYNINKGGTYIISNKELISINIIKVYLLILSLLLIETIIFIIVIFKNENKRKKKID